MQQKNQHKSKATKLQLEMVPLGGRLGQGFPGGSVIENLPASEGDSSLIPGLGRFPREGNGHPPQYSCLKDLMD